MVGERNKGLFLVFVIILGVFCCAAYGRLFTREDTGKRLFTQTGSHGRLFTRTPTPGRLFTRGGDQIPQAASSVGRTSNPASSGGSCEHPRPEVCSRGSSDHGRWHFHYSSRSAGCRRNGYREPRVIFYYGYRPGYRPGSYGSCVYYYPRQYYRDSPYIERLYWDGRSTEARLQDRELLKEGGLQMEERIDQLKVDWYMGHIQGAFSDDDYNKALMWVDEAVREDPRSAVTYFIRCQCLFVSGLYRDAVKALRDGLGMGVIERGDVLFPFGLYRGKDKLVEQIGRLQDAVRKEPFSGDLKLLLGFELLGDGRYGLAREALSEAGRSYQNKQAAATLLEVLE